MTAVYTCDMFPIASEAAVNNHIIQMKDVLILRKKKDLLLHFCRIVQSLWSHTMKVLVDSLFDNLPYA